MNEQIVVDRRGNFWGYTVTRNGEVIGSAPHIFHSPIAAKIDAEGVWPNVPIVVMGE